MDKLIIEPGLGIGTIKFGMSKNEVDTCIRAYGNRYTPHDITYFEDLFRVSYDENDQVYQVEIVSSLRDDFNCLFRDIDVFNTKVKEFVVKVDQISKYDRNEPELGSVYDFPGVGLYCWRSMIRDEEDLEMDWIKELNPESQEAELRTLYFETITLYKIYEKN